MTPPRLVAGGLGALPARRVADADRGRDGLRVLDELAEDDRRGAGGLEAHHLRLAACDRPWSKYSLKPAQ